MLLFAYARERLTPVQILPAVLLLVIGAQLGRGWSTVATAAAAATDAAVDAVVATCLVAAFRAWDDVMDRARDRVRHPNRVLVRAASAVPVMSGALILGGIAFVMLQRTHGAASAWMVLAIAGALAAWYGTRGPRSAAGDRILLLKYAVFTLALVGWPAALGARAVAAAAGVYLTACVYEWLHDADSPVFSVGGLR